MCDHAAPREATCFAGGALRRRQGARTPAVGGVALEERPGSAPLRIRPPFSIEKGIFQFKNFEEKNYCILKDNETFALYSLNNCN